MRFTSSLIALALVTIPTTANACCSYGCCDCSCVAIAAHNHSKEIAAALERILSTNGKKAHISAFSFTIDDKPKAAAHPKLFACKPENGGAVCHAS